MRFILFVFACSFFSLDAIRCALAQSSRSGVRTDRSSQRWLPPPEGRHSTIADQVRLLEMLGSRFASPAGGLSPSALPMPELSDAQLRQLDKAYQAWTEQSGGTQLPDWNSIPKEWVDQAVRNPEQLEQAQRLIQQYARQRKLPLAGPKPEQESGQPSSQRAARSAGPRSSPPQSFASGTQQGTPRAPQSLAARPQDTASSSPQAGAANARRTEAGLTEVGRTDAGHTEAGRTNERESDADAGDGQSQGVGTDARDSDAARAVSDPRADNPRNNNDRAKSGARTNGTGTSGARTSGPARVLGSAGTLAQASEDAQGERLQTATSGAGTSQSSSQPTTQSQPNNQSQPGAPYDAARIKALRELLEKLSAVQASQPQSSAASGKRSAQDQAAARGQAPGSQADQTALPPPQPGQGSVFRDRSARRSNGNPLADEADRDRLRESQNVLDELPSTTQDSFDVPAMQVGDAAGDDTFFVPPMQETAAAAEATERSSQRTHAEQLRSSARRAATQHSFSNGSGNGWSTKRMGDSFSEAASRLNSASNRLRTPQTASEMNTRLSPGDSQADIQAKLQRDIGRFGWEKTLREIIETTFKDEPPPAASSQIASANESSAGSRSSQPRPSARRSLTIDPATAQRSVEALSDSRFKKVVAEVWKAIATAPPTAAASSSSARATSASAERKWKWDGKFDESGYQVQIALLAIAVVALAVWISRKRPALFRSDRGIELRWAEAALAEGIRTRADVIRAFHRFVSHTTEPVASWWTHRYVAGRLAQSSPQLAVALSDLSSVYEQARYMPPEAELSADQINRATQALRKCVAWAKAPASISAV